MRAFTRAAAAAAAVLAIVGIGAPASFAQAPPAVLQLGPVATSTHPDLSAVYTPPASFGQKTVVAGAVTVTEGGKPVPSRLERLAHNRLEVVLVIDTSGSMKGDAFNSAKMAASAFIARLPLDAKVALVAFGTEPRLASPLTDDRNALIGAIQQLAVGGETALNDAVQLATVQFSGDAGSRRSVVLLSDGGDTKSKIDLASANAAITASRARLDVVELPSDLPAHDALVSLAGAGGGRIASAGDPAALAGIYDTIAGSLSNEYALTWRSPSHGRTELVVRADLDGVTAEKSLVLDYPAAPRPVAPAAAPTTPTPPEPYPAWVLVVGTACMALALFVVGLLAFAPRHGRRRRARLGVTRPSPIDTAALTGLADRATKAADAALVRHGRSGGLNERLEQAGVDLRPGEYAVLAATATVVGVALGFVIVGPLLAVLLGMIIAAAFHVTLSVKRSRRQAKFSDQLCDTLQHLAGALRAGHGLLQAIETLGRESPEPTNSEFRRLVVEARLGRDFSESLHAMSARVGTDDFAWVVQAIDIHREVGGDLAEVLDTIASTVRARNQLFRQVKTLTAEGRLSAYILIGLPLFVAVALKLVNPPYFKLLTVGSGLAISGASVVMLIVGALWFRKLCRLEY